MKKETKKVIDLYTVPRVYRPESVQQRMDRERKSLENANAERINRLADARKKMSNKKDRD